MSALKHTTEALATTTTKELSYAKLGTWLFLASEIMLFGALFSSYILLREGSPTWPHGWEHLNVNLATLNTVFLITSSVTVILSYLRIQKGDVAGFRKFMLATILLGCAFLVVKYFEYSHKIHLGLLPKTSLFFGIYYVMTGLHVLHIIGGLVVNAYLMGPGVALHRENPEKFVGRIEAAGLYWHFVDLVWIFLFPTIYLL